jgi:host factor-I protein
LRGFRCTPHVPNDKSPISDLKSQISIDPFARLPNNSLVNCNLSLREACCKLTPLTFFTLHSRPETFVDNKPALQNIQDGFLNTARRDRSEVTIFLLYGAKLTGRIKSFDKFSLILESGSREMLIFKHAISTIQHERTENGELSQSMNVTSRAAVSSATTEQVDS